MTLPRTLDELRASGWRSRSVKAEMRENLIRKLREGEEVFPGIVGFDKTVIPRIQNAILSAHDFILLGLRGQAKTRLLRSLPALLDEFMPAVEGCEIQDDPTRPVCARCRRLAEVEGGALPVRWVPRAERYREKLATPDVTIADLIGDIDPIKAANRRLEFADPEVIHYGIVPRTHRGIFAINELPDLQGRIQVGLLNILEEGDIQIRGFPMRLELDLCMVFSANPEDYTNRGSIITPLRDRIASQIVTHYPRTLEEAMAITRQEAWRERGGEAPIEIPDYLERCVEEVAFQARASDLVDQASGVSARMTISLMENLVSNAERRAVRAGEAHSVARISDLYAASSAVSGKVELVYDGEREGVEAVARMLIGKAVKEVFDTRLPDAYADPSSESGPSEYAALLAWFQADHVVDLSDDLSTEDLRARLVEIPGLAELARAHLPADEGPWLAAGMEFVLEGLHQSSLLAKQELVGGRVYRDMLAEMAQSLEG
jgi:magnesium chelatase subunit I